MDTEVTHANLSAVKGVSAGALESRLEKVTMLEPLLIAGFFEASLGKDSRFWQSAFGNLLDGAQIPATAVNDLHESALIGRAVSALLEPHVRLGIYG